MKGLSPCGPGSMYLLPGLLFIVLLAASCKPPENKAPWVIPHAKSIDLYPIPASDNLLILAVEQDGQDGLGAFDLKKDRPTWFYPDQDSVLASAYYNLSTYQHENKLLFPLVRKTIALNTTTGQLLWRNDEKSNGQADISGIGKWAFRSYPNYEQAYAFLQQINTHSGKSSEVFRIEPAGSEQLHLRSPWPYFDKSTGDTLLLAGLTSYLPNVQTKSELLVWSIRNKRIIKRLQAYPDNRMGYGITKQGIGSETASYWVAKNDLFKINMDNLSEEWRVTLPSDMLTSRPMLTDKMLYFPAENDSLYALDPASGQVHWANKMAGTPSRLCLWGNYIFVVGGSDQALHIFHQMTGEVIEPNKEALTHQVDGQAWTRTFTIKEDRITLTDGINWYLLPVNQLLPTEEQ